MFGVFFDVICTGLCHCSRVIEKKSAMMITWSNALRIHVGGCAKVVEVTDESRGRVQRGHVHVCVAHNGLVQRFHGSGEREFMRVHGGLEWFVQRRIREWISQRECLLIYQCSVCVRTHVRGVCGANMTHVAPCGADV